MAATNIPQLFKGLTSGITSDKSVLNVVPTELEEDSRNIKITRDGVLQPRRGADFVGQSDTGNYMHTIRTSATSAETSQESPNGINGAFRTSTGGLLDRTIVFQDNVFKIFDHQNLKNYDAPDQTITPANLSRINTEQKFYSVQMVFGDNRLFFTGKKIQPGYIYLKSDNSTFGIAYLSVHTRNLTAATAASSRVQYLGKYYECIEAHTSAATDLTNTDTFGETIFNRYWMELDNTTIPGGTSTWTAATAYTTNFDTTFSKYTTLASDLPIAVDFWDNRLWIATESKSYYSQIAIDVEDIKNTLSGTHEYSIFAQANDPFSTDDSSLAASDGGTITVDSGNMIDLKSMEDSMFIGTSTRVFEVRGATSSFSHTDFKVASVIDEGINGVENMVIANSKLYVFATTNIYGALDETRLAQSTPTKFGKIASTQIKDYYKDIPKLNKGTGRAVYSSTTEKIYFFHNGTTTTFDTDNRNVTGQNGYAKDILVLDIAGKTAESQDGNQSQVQNHIEIWTYADDADTGGTYIAGAFIATPTVPTFNTVVVGADTIVVGADTVIVGGASGATEGADEVVLIVMEKSISGSTATINATLGILESANLKDWEADGTRVTDYTSTALLGTQAFENLLDTQTVPYAIFVFEKLTDGTGSCLLRTSFNFSEPTTTGEGTGKTSTQTEIYLDTKNVAGGTVSMTNYKATYYKHRIQGRGIVFQPSLENTAGKDFKLLGWGQLVKTKRR